MRLNRILKKIFFHIFKYFVFILDVINPRLSMLFYNKLLKFVGVKIKGIPRYISYKVKFDTFELIEIGDRVVISERVILLTHDYTFTTALISIGEMPSRDVSFNSKIVIGNNVFIGMCVTVLPGTQIGNNVIIGAGSVVRGSIPENSVYIGNPGKVIGSIQDYAYKCKLKNESQNSNFHEDYF